MNTALHIEHKIMMNLVDYHTQSHGLGLEGKGFKQRPIFSQPLGAQFYRNIKITFGNKSAK
jgi:hypothetical protein